MTITRKGTPEWRVHPGEILRQEFLQPLKLSVYQLAKELRVPAPRLNDVVLQKRGISADTAIRLAKFFGTSEQFWLALQAAYEVSRTKEELRNEIDRIRPWQPDTRGTRP
jgi:addiction module HigA family antidote